MIETIITCILAFVGGWLIRESIKNDKQTAQLIEQIEAMNELNIEMVKAYNHFIALIKLFVETTEDEDNT